jgi:hypothetical protein
LGYSAFIHQESSLLRRGSPPLVPIWPGVRVVERNPFPFFPFNPRWQQELERDDLEAFCSALKLAWISERPCYLPNDVEAIEQLLRERGTPRKITGCVISRFETQPGTGLLFFPPQLRALRRLIEGEDMYSLLWDESL